MKFLVPKDRLYFISREWLQWWKIFLPDLPIKNYSFDQGGIHFRFVKARSIPQMLMLSDYDFGICGSDIVENSMYDSLIKVRSFPMDKDVRLVAAVLGKNRNLLTNPPRRPIVIATEYPNIAHDWAESKGLSHIVLHTFGATEGFAVEDADIVIDVVETGETLEQNGLVQIEDVSYVSTGLYCHKSKEGRYYDLLELLENNLK